MDFSPNALEGLNQLAPLSTNYVLFQPLYEYQATKKNVEFVSVKYQPELPLWLFR